MATFADAIDIVLKNEGEKFTDFPGDPGGATKWGITLKAAQAHGLCQSADQLKLITQQQAEDFYRQYYWQPIFDEINDQGVATKIFDTGVNVGPVTAVQYLQHALNALNEGNSAPLLCVDGHIGPQTLATTNAADLPSLLAKYRELQEQHYQAWVSKDPNDRSKFLRGLLNRVYSC